MKDYDLGHMIPEYGDGGHTTPTTWRAALGGYVWSMGAQVNQR